jgi:hypothetical protein
MPRLRPRAVLVADDLPRTRATISNERGGTRSAEAVETAAAPTATDPGESNYLGRLVAYIPAEIIAVYHTTQSFLARDTGPDVPGATTIPVVPSEAEPFLVGLGLVLLIATPIWIYFSTASKGEPPAWHQIANAGIAFAIWLLVAGNPVVEWFPSWDPVYGSVAMVLAVMLVFPLIEMIVRWAKARATS